MLLYADDTVVYYAASDVNQLERVLNVELKFLQDWSTKNELFICPKKTAYVIFGCPMRRQMKTTRGFEMCSKTRVVFIRGQKIFFFTSCGSLIPFTRANAQWVIHGFN